MSGSVSTTRGISYRGGKKKSLYCMYCVLLRISLQRPSAFDRIIPGARAPFRLSYYWMTSFATNPEVRNHQNVVLFCLCNNEKQSSLCVIASQTRSPANTHWQWDWIKHQFCSTNRIEYFVLRHCLSQNVTEILLQQGSQTHSHFPIKTHFNKKIRKIHSSCLF